MKINGIGSNNFLGNIRIKIKNKSLVSAHDIRVPTKMALIKRIAEDNDVSMFVGEDVILFDSSNKLQKQLSKAGINYSVEDSSIDCEVRDDGKSS